MEKKRILEEIRKLKNRIAILKFAKSSTEVLEIENRNLCKLQESLTKFENDEN